MNGRLPYVWATIWPNQIDKLPRQYSELESVFLVCAVFCGLEKFAREGLYASDVESVSLLYTVNKDVPEIHTQYVLRIGSASAKLWYERLKEPGPPETSFVIDSFDFFVTLAKRSPVVVPRETLELMAS